jgi:hypothetical protein
MTVTQARPPRAARLANSWRSRPLGVPRLRLLAFGIEDGREDKERLSADKGLSQAGA